MFCSICELYENIEYDEMFLEVSIDCSVFKCLPVVFLVSFFFSLTLKYEWVIWRCQMSASKLTKRRERKKKQHEEERTSDRTNNEIIEGNFMCDV